MLKNNSFKEYFAHFASAASRATGSVWAFILALLIVVSWAATGPYFDYSETWQIVINTTTTILTFLMIFLLQHSQNREGKAIQLKLDELIASQTGASNRLIDVEDLSDEQLEELINRRNALLSKSFQVEENGVLKIEDE